jgi:hypothetical protein
VVAACKADGARPRPRRSAAGSEWPIGSMSS